MLETTTIKERLLADIRDRLWTFEDLAKRHGLSGHDLAKNLEQLRKEGLINLKWRDERIESIRPNRGALNMDLLGLHNNGSKAEHGENATKLSDAINRLPWQGEWHRWDMDLLKQWSGMNSSQVASTMKVLRESGRLLQSGGGKQGIPIKGVRWRGEQPPAGSLEVVAEGSSTDKPKSPSGPSPAVAETLNFLKDQGRKTMPETPLLHQYMDARRIAALSTSDNPYIDVRFQKNALAEEAVQLWEALRGR